MASIHRDPRTDNFLLMFRYGGKQYKKSLKTKDETEAEALRGRIKLTLLELERGRRTLPADSDLWEFLISDGQRTQKAEAPTVVTLQRLFERYEAELPRGALEGNSLDTIRGHWKHVLRIVGARTMVQAVTTPVLQRYVNQRAVEKHRGKLISAYTIRKEVGSFRSAWKWGKGRDATVHERTARPGHAPLTKDEATYYFNRALAGSKWSVVRGFHVFRHSFASNMAREGVDQRLIDSYMGHQTEEMRKRYSHLFPQERVKAIRSVFG